MKLMNLPNLGIIQKTRKGLSKIRRGTRKACTITQAVSMGQMDVTFHTSSGQWQKSVGKVRSDAGTLKYYKWWLGKDETNAQMLAARIDYEWKGLIGKIMPKGWYGIVRDSQTGGMLDIAEVRQMAAMTGLDDFGMFQFAGRFNVPAVEVNNRLRVEGESYWNEIFVAVLRKYKDLLYERGEASPKFNRPVAWSPNKNTDEIIQRPSGFHAAIVAFQKKVKQSATSKRGQRNLSDRIENLRQGLPDLPLESIKREQLDALARYFRERPFAKQVTTKGKTVTTKRRISISYAKAHILAAKQLFDWLYENEWWDAPRKFEKAFTNHANEIPRSQEELLLESQGDDIASFTVDELQKLWAAANRRYRTLILLGLNCGFSVAECGTLLVGEVHLNADPPYIRRLRRKTLKLKNPVVGQWALWPETASALYEELNPRREDEFINIKGKAAIKSGDDTHVLIGEPINYARRRAKRLASLGPKNATDPVLLTEHGSPLHSESERRNNSVQQGWDRLIKKAGVRHLSFKFLRKTGARLIRRIGGKEFRESYLCHTDKTSGKYYDNPPFDLLATHIMRMREELSPIFNSASPITINESNQGCKTSEGIASVKRNMEHSEHEKT